MSLPNDQPGQVIRTGPRDRHKHIALFGGEWAKVRPAQAEVEGQIPVEFEVVLNKEAPQGFAVVLADGCGESSRWIESAAFVMRCIVEEIPQIEEAVVWHATASAVLQVEKAREFAPKLNGVAPEDLGGHIFIAISPLIKDSADIRSKRI